MVDQTTRLEIATVKAEVGSNILSRFSNDALSAEQIPTDSGPIDNLKQVIVSIQEEGADKISIATSIYATMAAGIAATTKGAIFLVQSSEADEIYEVWQNVAGVATDTGKRALNSQAVSSSMNAAATSATQAQDARDSAQGFSVQASDAVITVQALTLEAQQAVIDAEAATSGKQPLDATLTALSAVIAADNKLIYSTGIDAFATTDLPEFGRTLIASADDADALSTLGLSAANSLSLLGWTRSVLLQAITQASQMLDAQPVCVWEFANLVTSKPTPSDPATWDWTPALIALFNHAEPRKLITPGMYLSGALTIKSGTKLYMAGATIKAISTLDANTPLLQNYTVSGSADTYYDRDIEIFGGVFAGNSGARTNTLLSFLKTFNVQLNGTRVTGNKYQGIAVGGCKHTIFDGIEIDLCGNTTVTAEGGPAVWIGSASTSRSYDVQFRGAYIHDNEWSACYANGTDVVFDKNCRLINNKESAIFGNSTDCVNLRFFGTIDGTTKKNISGSGIECGGAGLQVVGATIVNTANGCIDLTDASDFVVDAATLGNARRDSISFPQASVITLLSTNSAGSQIRRGKISGCKMRDSSSPAYAGILVAGSGAIASSVTIEDNNLLGTTYTQGQIVLASPQTGAGIIRRNNAGTTDIDIKAGQFQLQLASGTQTITGVGFRPRHVAFYTTDTSASRAASCQSNVGQAGTLQCGMYSANDASGRVGGPTGDIVHLTDGIGSVLSRASTLVYTDDGFTLTIPATNSASPYVNFVAYP